MSSEEMTTDAAPAAEAPAPAADAPAAAVPAAPAEGEAAPAAPKRRGRPRKKPAPEAEAVSAAGAPEAAPAPAPEPAPASAAEASAASEPAAAPAAEEASSAPAPAKRTRRQGRSTTISTSDAPAEASSADASAEASAEASVEASADDASSTQAKRGRPRKSVQVDTESDSSKAERREQREQREPREQRQNQQRHQQRNNQQQGQNNRGGSGKQNGKQKQGQNNRNGSGNDSYRRQRRSHGASSREPMVPKTNVEELSKLKVAELRERAAELDVDVTGLKKAELVEKVFEASIRAEGFIEVQGVLDVLQDGYGFLRTKGYLPSENDVYVGLSTIRRNNLRKGDLVRGQTRPARENEKYCALQQVTHVNGTPVDEMGPRVKFGDLTPIFPDECLVMEHGRNTITARVIDLVSPIGKGQRGLIVSPPKAGKTTILKDIAAAITANNPEVHLMCLLVDERPEEVTDMQRSIKGEVISSTFDMPTENHIAVSELVIERAKRLVELGEDVVILLDSLTRLARAYNLAQPASGRILSGGVDSTALYPPKRFLGAARNIEGGGSLTILASALIETGSKMDEVIFEEFKGTGNMELRLDRQLADRRVFPAIDPVASGTRREDLLLNPQEAPLIWAVRRILANTSSTERAMDMLIKSLKQTNTNQEFLLRTAKKAQGSMRDTDNFEL